MVLGANSNILTEGESSALGEERRKKFGGRAHDLSSSGETFLGECFVDKSSLKKKKGRNWAATAPNGEHSYTNGVSEGGESGGGRKGDDAKSRKEFRAGLTWTG